MKNKNKPLKGHLIHPGLAPTLWCLILWCRIIISKYPIEVHGLLGHPKDLAKSYSDLRSNSEENNGWLIRVLKMSRDILAIALQHSAPHNHRGCNQSISLNKMLDTGVLALLETSWHVLLLSWIQILPSGY